MQDLAIIIVNYNTRQDLSNCLRSINASQCTYSFEVVVVDNCSSDGSADMVRQEFPWVQHLIVTDHNGGYAFANNVGMRAVGLEGSFQGAPRYVLLLNPDTVVPERAFQDTLAYLDENQDIGVLGPKLVRQDGSLDKACRRSFPSPAVSFYRLSGLGRLFPESKRFGRYNLTFLGEDEQADVDAVVGAYMLMRTSALQQAGLLDEAFFMYGEDLDLCFRIKEHGWRVVYYPGVTVLHVKGAASSKASKRATLAFYDAMRIFHDKHYRSSTFFVVNWIIDLGIAILKSRALLADALRPASKKYVASARH